MKTTRLLSLFVAISIVLKVIADDIVEDSRKVQRQRNSDFAKKIKDRVAKARQGITRKSEEELAATKRAIAEAEATKAAAETARRSEEHVSEAEKAAAEELEKKIAEEARKAAVAKQIEVGDRVCARAHVCACVHVMVW